MHAVAKSLLQIEDDLNDFFLDRRDAIRAMMLALLSGEHIFIGGPPGTTKSMLVRTLVGAINGPRYFEAQLSKRTPAEAVLGPLDIKEFRENGNYFLKRKGYATQVELLMLDEIGKASPVLGHDLLALLNERVYHEVNGGRSVHTAPLSTAFTASNEMLTDESDSAAALWDRLLFRVMVDYLSTKRDFAKLLTSTAPSITQTVEWDDLHEAITVAVPAITMTRETVAAMVKLRSDFVKQHLMPSDRRWRWSIKAMQANAFLNGRSEIGPEDLAVLRFTLWDTVEQIDKVHELCLSASNPFVKPLTAIRKGINEIEAGVKEREAGEAGARWQYGKESMDKLNRSRDSLDTMLMEAMGEPIPGFKEVSDLHEATMLGTVMVCLEQPEEAARAMIASKLGSGDGGNK